MASILRTFIAWVPILCLFLVLCFPQADRCVPIDPGGKELVCGYEYASSGVKFAFGLCQIVAIVSFLASIYFAINKQLSRTGLAALLATVLLAVFFLLLTLYIGADDYP